MKLLIVDDEKLTREGLSKSCNWKSLGINNIYEADDGINGLDNVKKYQPDILLTDVRMPRMDGIELAEKVQKLLPNCCIIFMSGYSDKKYLKAAIKLKAINYIEKPINSQEVKETIMEAIKNINMQKLNKHSIDIQKNEIISNLVHNLNYSNSKSNCTKYMKQFENLGLHVTYNTYFNSVLFKIIRANEGFNLKYIENYLVKYLNVNSKKIHQIHTLKQNDFFIFHLFYNIDTSFSHIQNILNQLALELSKLCTFFICIGKRVKGINKIYESYNSAVILLQNSFFHDMNRVLTYVNNDCSVSTIPDDIESRLSVSLNNKDEESTKLLLNDIYLKLKGNRKILPNIAKEFYYKLFLKLEEAGLNIHEAVTDFHKENHSTLNTIMNCETLNELHHLLMNVVHKFFQESNNNSEENLTIVYIKEYISKNYKDNRLSIKSISDFIRLSPSYVCTIFKNETYKTLNQYITEYRIEKAKNLLLDPRNKITDISFQVGYTDGNYFSKSFKKLVGSSPTEFREKHVQ